jgi:hypothetical protein
LSPGVKLVVRRFEVQFRNLDDRLAGRFGEEAVSRVFDAELAFFETFFSNDRIDQVERRTIFQLASRGRQRQFVFQRRRLGSAPG